MTMQQPSSLSFWQRFRLTSFVYLFSLTKIPLIFYVRPKVVELSDHQVKIKIPLNWRTKNHLGVMYFGALSIGADLCIGLVAAQQIFLKKKKIDFLFKDFQISFLKRADDHVYFICDEVQKVIKSVQSAENTTERVEIPIKGYAMVPTKFQESVATFTLTLTMKNRT